MDIEPSLPVCQGGEDATQMEDNTDPTMDVDYIGMDMETGTMKNNVVEEIVEMMTGPGYMGVVMAPRNVRRQVWWLK